MRPEALEGTLAYISPEQTGRMNRTMDFRSDYYSLGVTLYELLCKDLPFHADDPIGLVHCHVAKIPKAPHERNAAVPQVLSRIVLKLMAKDADDRYQGLGGLKADLEKCLARLKETGQIQDFEIGSKGCQQSFPPTPKAVWKRKGRSDSSGCFSKSEKWPI